VSLVANCNLVDRHSLLVVARRAYRNHHSAPTSYARPDRRGRVSPRGLCCGERNEYWYFPGADD
jgi:hypothetical protein